MYITCVYRRRIRRNLKKWIIKMETWSSLDYIVFENYCTMHGQHLITKDMLDVLERTLQELNCGWKFFSGLAKLMHVWRDDARKFYMQWLRAYGPRSANEHARKMPPKCLSGRWGSTSMVCQFLERGEQSKVKNKNIYICIYILHIYIYMHTYV